MRLPFAHFDDECSVCVCIESPFTAISSVFICWFYNCWRLIALWRVRVRYIICVASIWIEVESSGSSTSSSHINPFNWMRMDYMIVSCASVYLFVLTAFLRMWQIAIVCLDLGVNDNDEESVFADAKLARLRLSNRQQLFVFFSFGHFAERKSEIWNN